MADDEKRYGSRGMTIVTGLTGSAAAGLAAAILAPQLPVLVAGAAVAGFVGSALIARKYDEPERRAADRPSRA